MNTFCKAERLCNKTHFEALLASGFSFIKYPYRIVVQSSPTPGEFPARIAISVSKRKFKHAVERNRLKRLTREAFRLNKKAFYEQLNPEKTLDILFIYLDKQLTEYPKIEKSMQSAMLKIGEKFKEN